MSVTEIVSEQGVEIYRWTADEFMSLVNAGIIHERRRVELLDGIIEREMLQGELHRFIFRALNRIFSAMGAFDQGLESIPPVILGKSHAIEPDFGLLGQREDDFQTPREGDLIWAIEISDATIGKDLGRKKRAYARAKVPHYWVIDAKRRGIWIFWNPVGDNYADERFVLEGEAIEFPILLGTLKVESLFPAATP